MTNALKDLARKRNKAKQEYDKVQKSVAPYYKRYCELAKATRDEFIKQKLFISIDKLPNYLQGKEISDIEVVYKDGSTDGLYHEYGISYETSKWSDEQCKYVQGRILSSGVADDGYSFEEDIDETGIVGFYNLELEDGTQVKETYMDEIIKRFE